MSRFCKSGLSILCVVNIKATFSDDTADPRYPAVTLLYGAVYNN